MKEINLPPFYVGQKVVALNGGQYTVKGQEYVVLAINKCCHWVVDIGHPSLNIYCSCCRKEFGDGISWVKASRLAPINEAFQSISLEKVLEEETPLISVN